MNARAHALLAPALMLLGCGTQNMASVEPVAICANVDPQPACVYQSTCALVNMDGRESVDVNRAPYLWVPIQYNNQNPSNADPTTGRVNSRDAQIERFEMHYTGSVAVPDAAVDQSVTVLAAGSQTAGVHLIPPATMTILSAALAGSTGFTEIVAEVKARGHYTDGTAFVTGSLKIPVDVCAGCYGTLPTCSTAGQVYQCCPWFGQTANCKCM